MTYTVYETRGGFPPMTRWVKILLIANLAIWAATFLLSVILRDPVLAWLFHLVGVYPQRAFTQPWFAFWQPFTYMFFHSLLDPMHVLWNCLGLYFFGVFLEQDRGAREFLRIYLVGGVAGGLGFLLFEGLILGWWEAYCVGASGAIFAIVVAVATLYPRMQVWIFGMVPVQMWILAGVFVAINLATVLATLSFGAAGHVAASTHLVGAAMGFLTVRYPVFFQGFGSALAGLPERLQARRERRRAEDLRTRRARVDELLDKINRQGIGSLTRSEQDYLKKSSKLYDDRR